MAKSKDQIYCEHILEAIAGIESFVKDFSFEQFSRDLKPQLAVARELEIIGEAAKRFSEKFKDDRSQIPWRKVTGMRDFLSHDYMAVDLKEVWHVATEDVEELKRALEIE